MSAHDQCENEIPRFQNDAYQCPNTATTVCAHCKNLLCWTCADSCAECGHNLCVGCVEDHAKATGHAVELVTLDEVKVASLKAAIHDQQTLDGLLERLQRLVESTDYFIGRA